MPYRFKAHQHDVAFVLGHFEEKGVNLEDIKNLKQFLNALFRVANSISTSTGNKKRKFFLGKAWEIFVEYLINNSPSVRTLGLQDFEPTSSLGITDFGIDGMATNYLTDEPCTVQCKLKSNPNQVVERNADHIGNFFEQSVSVGVTEHRNMVIITNAYEIADNIKDYKNVRYADIDNLTVSHEKFWKPFFEALRYSSDYGCVSREDNEDYVLYLHQHEVRGILKKFEKGKGKVIMPTGGGKTIVIIMDLSDRSKRRLGKKGIFLVSYPRLALMDQIQNKVYERARSPYRELYVCSKGDFKKDIHFTGERALMPDSTTNPIEITEYLLRYLFSEEERDDAPMIIHSTYASLFRVAKALNLLVENLDGEDHELLLNLLDTWYADEAHNLVPGFVKNSDEEEKRMNEMVEATTELGELFERNLFFTATDKQNGTTNDMSNIDIYGEILYSIPAHVLVERGIIVRPRVTAIVVPKDVPASKIEEKEDRRDFTYIVAAVHEELEQRAKTNCPVQIMAFCKSARVTIDFERELEKLFPDANVVSVRAETTAEERKRLFEEFRTSEFSILLNYDIVSEGIDIDGTSAVLIGRGMNDIKIVQAAGRCLRLTESDRNRHRMGMITVDNPHGWKKYAGNIYCPLEEESISNINVVDNVHNILSTLMDAGFNNVYDDLDVKVPRPQPKDDDETRNIMDDPEVNNVYQNKKLAATLQLRYYDIQLSEMSLEELVEQL